MKLGIPEKAVPVSETPLARDLATAVQKNAEAVLTRIKSANDAEFAAAWRNTAAQARDLGGSIGAVRIPKWMLSRLTRNDFVGMFEKVTDAELEALAKHNNVEVKLAAKRVQWERNGPAELSIEAAMEIFGEDVLRPITDLHVNTRILIRHRGIYTVYELITSNLHDGTGDAYLGKGGLQYIDRALAEMGLKRNLFRSPSSASLKSGRSKKALEAQSRSLLDMLANDSTISASSVDVFNLSGNKTLSLVAYIRGIKCDFYAVCEILVNRVINVPEVSIRLDAIKKLSDVLDTTSEYAGWLNPDSFFRDDRRSWNEVVERQIAFLRDMRVKMNDIASRDAGPEVQAVARQAAAIADKGYLCFLSKVYKQLISYKSRLPEREWNPYPLGVFEKLADYSPGVMKLLDSDTTPYGIAFKERIMQVREGNVNIPSQ